MKRFDASCSRESRYRKIVDEEERDQQPTARKEQHSGLDYSIDELAELKSETLDVALSALRKKPGISSALQVLRLLRTVPTRGELAARRTADPSQQIEAYKFRAAIQLALIALERNRIYGTPLPVPQKELDERVRKAMDEENRAKQDGQIPDPRSVSAPAQKDGPSKASGQVPSRTTAAEFEHIRRKLLEGMSISQIVREEENERHAAARKEQQQAVGYSTDELADVKSDVLNLVVSELREKGDLRRALQVWRLLRTLPTRGELAALRSPDQSEQIDPYTMCAATQLALMTLERSRANGNGLPVPEEEADNRMRKLVQEKNARAAQHRKTPDP